MVRASDKKNHKTRKQTRVKTQARQGKTKTRKQKNSENKDMLRIEGVISSW